MKSKGIDMIHGPLLGGVIRFTVPVILSSVLQLLFNAADLVVVGQFCGSISVGAVSSTTALTNLIINLFVGLSVGSGVCVAHALGCRNEEEVHRAVHTSVPMALVSGVFLTGVGVLLSTPLLKMMSTPSDVLPLAALYMKIYFGGITFTILYNFCSSILRAAGDTRTPLIYLTIAGIINVILNLFFVIVLNMNVAGVALATIISQAISAVLVLLALMRRTDACRLRLKQMKIYKPQLMKIIRIGLPAGVQGSLFSISNVIIQSSVNSFGSGAFIAGNGAAANIEGFVYTSLNAFNQTAVNYIGQNMGAQQYHRVRKIFWTCLGCVTAVGLTLGLTVFGFARQLLSIYITDDPEAIAYGVIRMSFICAPYFVCGLMDVATGALRGMGNSLVPMIVTVLGVCGLRIGWIYTIFQVPRFHTPSCLYASYIISWTVTFAVEFFMFHRDIKKLLQKEPVPLS